MAVTSWRAGQAGPTEPELAPGSAVKGAEVARGQLVRDSQLCLKPPLWMSPNVSVFCWGGDNAFNSRGRGKSRHWGQAAICFPEAPLRLGAGNWDCHVRSILLSHFSLSFHIFNGLLNKGSVYVRSTVLPTEAGAILSRDLRGRGFLV